MTSARALALCACALLGPAASAQQGGDAPLSAIDWLSEIPLTEPDGLPPILLLEDPIAETGEVAPVEAAPLQDGGGTGTGLLAPSLSGLPSTLWQGATLEEIAAGFEALPPDALAPIRLMRQRLLLATTAPPRDVTGAAFLEARLRILYDLGALILASALAEEAGPDALRRPRLFAIYTDIALLTGQEDGVCSRLRANAALSDDLALRIFCLARGDDWSAAALALETGEALGVLDPAMAELMAQFLEPEFADGTPPPLPASGVTPLVMRLREAIGAPLSTAELPRAYAVSDLRATMGWKAQLEAAERLIRSGGVDASLLLGLYDARVPAASGGVWDRATALQDLRSALLAGDPAARAEAVARARDEMAEAGLEAELAAMVAADLAEAQMDDAVSARLLLLSDRYEAAPGGSDLARALAAGNTSGLAGDTPRARALIEAFSGRAPTSQPVSLGLGILEALATLDAAQGGGNAGVAEALQRLRTVGLEDIARRIALHLLLAP